MSTIADVTVCMPWRATLDRVPAFKRCINYWRSHGFPVVLGDSNPAEPFNRSAARNNAVQDCDTSMVIVADADVLPAAITEIRRAVAAAADGCAVTPYRRYLLLPDEAVTAQNLSTVEPIREYSVRYRPCGVTVIGKDAWNAVGGYDERFGAGWGYEDAAFILACETLIGTKTLPGVLYAFNHSGARRRDPKNRRLHWWYQRAEGDVEQMRRLTKRP